MQKQTVIEQRQIVESRYIRGCHAMLGQLAEFEVHGQWLGRLNSSTSMKYWIIYLR